MLAGLQVTEINWMWLERWSGVIQGFLTVLLTAALVYLYYQQKSVLEDQEDIMDKQREISASQQAMMESEYQPNLFLYQYEFRRDGIECLYMADISNEGPYLAQEIFLRSVIFVAVDENATEYRVSDHQLNSSDPVTPLSDIEFVSDVSFYPLLSDEKKDSRLTIEAPFYIEDIPSWQSNFRESQNRDLTPYAVSFVRPSETCRIESNMRFAIKRRNKIEGIPLEFTKVLEMLRKSGFEEAHIWIGLEYLDGLGNEQRLTLHTRTLELKGHYVDSPIEEWGRCKIAKELNELQSTKPNRSYLLDKE